MTTASLVHATGRGLREGRKGQQGIFKIFVEKDAEVQREGDICDRLDVYLEGPGESQVWAKSHGNGTITITYHVAEPGKYDAHITFDQHRIPGSPFRLTIK